MARIPRQHILGEGSVFHVYWQCHNRDLLLKPKWVKKLLYALLLKYKEKYGVKFFSYIIMDNHFHASGQVPDLKNFSRFFQVVHSVLAQQINKRNKRCGQVIRDRFKSPLIQNDEALSQMMVYHDLNEVRCGKANDPKNNELSSYAHYAFGAPDPLLTEPEFYKNLGKTPRQRQAAYRAMVLEILVEAPRKKDGRFTQQLYVGDPLWVEEKYRELKKLRNRIREERAALGTGPPTNITSIESQ